MPVSVKEQKTLEDEALSFLRTTGTNDLVGIAAELVMPTGSVAAAIASLIRQGRVVPRMHPIQRDDPNFLPPVEYTRYGFSRLLAKGIASGKYSATLSILDSYAKNEENW